jgi:type I restriction enzyme S subunit
VLVINDGYRAKNEELASAGLPFARAGNIDGGFQFADADYFPEQELGRVGNKISQPGDVVFTSKGTVGRFAYVADSTPRFVYSPQLCFWRALDRERLDSRWLFYWMQSGEFQEQCDGVKGQTDMADYVSLRDQRAMSLTLPPIGEQRAVGRLLGALDDKIELNRRVNQTLESMARAIFRSWFVDFDPVVAKAEGRQPFGMSAEVAALFPNEFDESDPHGLPRGWTAVPIERCVQAVYDGPHATPPVAESGAIFLGIKNMPGSRIELAEVRHISEEQWARWTKRVTPEAGDIVFTYEATVGAFAVIPPGMRCCLGRRLALVRPSREHYYPYFLLHTFVSPPFQELLTSRLNQGSTVQRIPLTDFPAYEILWPGDGLARGFERIAEPLWRSIHVLIEQSRTLAALRDTLLPKLMSGELRVRDAEKLVGVHV